MKFNQEIVLITLITTSEVNCHFYLIPSTLIYTRIFIANTDASTLLLEDGSHLTNALSQSLTPSSSTQLSVIPVNPPEAKPAQNPYKTSSALTKREPIKVPEPTWHAPWELSAVVSGHLGWVRSIAFDPSNE